MKRSAFTLIELLVVIAIIAILAAILFPVFAQAKAAAKGTASLSNAKQVGTSFMIYTGDVDDTAPLDVVWGGTSPRTVGGRPVATWAYLMLPYTKSADIVQDPLTTNEPVPAGWTSTERYTLYPEFGYNYSTWSPTTGPAVDYVRSPISMTAPAAPAETVLLGSKMTRTELGGLYGYSGTKGVEMITSYGIEPPDCYSRDEYCFAGWGVSGNYTSLLPSVESGKYTGGDSLRRSGNMVTVFGDSHAAALKAGRLAAGTNYIDGSKTQNESAIVINDISKYMWDIK